MAHQTDSTSPAEERYRVAAVIAALEEVGICVARETVNRVSDSVLQLDTRNTGMFDRRWTKDQIDQLVTAFRLREANGLTWEGVATTLRSTPPLAQQADQEMEEIRAQFQQLAQRARDLADLAGLIAEDPDLASRRLAPTGGVAA